jgi:hypothetical protein
MSTATMIYLMITAMGIGGSMEKHGQPHDFWLDLAGSAVGFGLLYWGGFFERGAA